MNTFTNKLIIIALVSALIILHTDILYAISIDPLYASTSIVHGFKDKKEVSTATGFFYMDTDSSIYLVTNKHVIYGDKFADNPEPVIDQIKLILHSNSKNLSQNEEFLIDLFKEKKKIWLELESEPEIDVILVPLELNTGKYIIKPLDRNYIVIPNIEMGFEEIFLMGYPYGWYDNLNNLPITRVGHLYSPFKVPFRGKKIMLGDVETHPGMSGSPVLIKIRDYLEIDATGKREIKMGKTKVILVGIFSGQPLWIVENRKTGQKIQINHSLANIWFSDLILDILKQRTPNTYKASGCQ